MEAYVFGKQAARQIQRAVRKVERGLANVAPTYRPLAQTCCYIGKTGAGGIPGRSGTTPGSATVDLYVINSAGTLETLKDNAGTTRTLLIYNICSASVAAYTYIQIKQDVFGRYLVDVEDCP